MNRRKVLGSAGACAGAFFSASCAAKRGIVETASGGSPPTTTGASVVRFVRSIGGDVLSAPGGISAGPDGFLSVCDTGRRVLLRMSAGGDIAARFGGVEPRSGGVFQPLDVAAGNGVDVFVLDGSSGKVYRLDRLLRGASVVFDPGGVGSGRPSSGRFAPFGGIALDPESGDIFLTDRNEGTVIRIDHAGTTVRETGGFGGERKSLRAPAGIDVARDGAILVADPGLGAVAFATRFGAGMRLIGGDVLDAPVDVAALPDGRIAIADARGVVVMDRTGAAECSAGYGTGQTMAPRAVVFHDGTLFISDSRSRSILLYTLDKAGKTP